MGIIFLFFETTDTQSKSYRSGTESITTHQSYTIKMSSD